MHLLPVVMLEMVKLIFGWRGKVQIELLIFFIEEEKFKSNFGSYPLRKTNFHFININSIF